MSELRAYGDLLTADVNSKGVLDVDTVKGCTLGMAAHRGGGCYDACYAAAIAKFRGLDFTQSVTRVIRGPAHARAIERIVRRAPLGFFRIGTMGDPCHAWDHTCDIVEWLACYATPVIVTKHWRKATDEQLRRLQACGSVLNTSVSALDSTAELAHRERQLKRYADIGGDSIARVVSCEFNRADPLGAKLGAIQDRLLSLPRVIDNPLRVDATHPLARSGLIRLRKVRDLRTVRPVSVANEATHVGHCETCPDQCGLSTVPAGRQRPLHPQNELFAIQ